MHFNKEQKEADGGGFSTDGCWSLRCHEYVDSVCERCVCECTHLLVLLKLQFNGGLDAVAGVLVGLFKSQVHQVFVVRSSQVPTGEDDHIG